MSFFEKIKILSKTPEGAFGLLAAIFGIFFLFLIPPLQTPDEHVHFLRAYQISQGQIVPQNDGQKSGGYLPKSIDQTFGELDGTHSVSFHSELKYDIHHTKAAMHIPLNASDKKYYNITAAAAYSPVGYVPQIFAILVGRVFNAPIIFQIYLARFAVLAVWIAIVIFAIRLMPYKKWAVVVIALLPMMVAQSVSLGVDAVSIGTSILFLGLVLKFVSEKSISAKAAMSILFVASAMVLSKQIAIILLPLILFVGTKKFKPVKYSVWMRLSIILVPIIFLLIWTLIIGDPGKSLNQLENHQSTSGQIKYLIGQPLQFLVVLFNTFFFSWGDSVVNSVIGIFGWADTPLSQPFIALGYMILASALLLAYREKTLPLSKNKKVLIAAVAVVYLVALCAALYVTYSPVGFSIIYGLQGRYILPILFLLIPVAASTNALVTKRKYLLVTLAPMILLLVISLITIFFRFYIDYKY